MLECWGCGLYMSAAYTRVFMVPFFAFRQWRIYTSSSLGPTSPEPKSPQPFALSSNVSVFLPSSMYLTASGLAPPLQQPKLVCQLGSSKYWNAGQATASPSISKLPLLSFRRFLGGWPRHTLQDRASAPRYQDITPVVFHNRLVMLAVFGMFFGCIFATFTCM